MSATLPAWLLFRSRQNLPYGSRKDLSKALGCEDDAISNNFLREHPQCRSSIFCADVEYAETLIFVGEKAFVFFDTRYTVEAKEASRGRIAKEIDGQVLASEEAF
ncbi:MAG TPA: hypothetical protein DCP92_21080 [Nitrospiraceae bacterium]|jgi:hypothetical protein|nr:hypothetical protein [Nitrospiraceae bacterium]